MSDTPRTDLEFPDGSFIEGDECADLARQLERELNEAKARIEVLEGALRRISFAQPDQLDHGIDVAIIERCSRAARAALEKS